MSAKDNYCHYEKGESFVLNTSLYFFAYGKYFVHYLVLVMYLHNEWCRFTLTNAVPSSVLAENIE